MSTARSHKAPHAPWDAPWDAFDEGRAWCDFSPAEQERIVRHHAPRIRYIALRLKARLPKSIELGELISAGTLGLMEALGKFRAHLGIRFEAYAESRVRGAMLDELRRLDWFPRALRQRIRQIDAAIRQVENEYGRQPTEEEIQRITGLEIVEVRQGLEALQHHLWVSLEAIQDYVSAEHGGIEGEPYRNAVRRELLARMASLLHTLTPREKLVLSLYYHDELNMRETAQVMGITEGRVSQLHTQALGRLRREFAQQYGHVEAL